MDNYKTSKEFISSLNHIPKEVAQTLFEMLDKLETDFIAEQEARKQVEVDYAALLESIRKLRKMALNADIDQWHLSNSTVLKLTDFPQANPGTALFAELRQYRKALEIVCEEFSEGKGCPCIRDLFNKQVDPYRNSKCDTCLKVYGEDPPIIECYIDYFLQKGKKLG